MDDSGEWSLFEPQVYEIPKFLGEDDINRVIENLKRSNVEQAEIQFGFKSENALKKFMQQYEEQIVQEEMVNYYQDEDPNQANKFRRVNGLNIGVDYEVRQLRFPSFQFLKVFTKFYQSRLHQIQTEYHYKLQIHGYFLRVYYPKNQKISSFFKNQIFQMKTKLILYFSNHPEVIKKVKYSTHFSKLMESSQIAAMYKINRQGIQAAIFYSNVHNNNQILSFVSKHMSQHTTVLNLFDKNLPAEINRNIFKLIASFLSETIKNIQKQQQIIVQTNFEKCCILVHDRHECHTDAKNQILKEIGRMIFFRMEGKDMRSLFNKVIKNHKIYPYLRVRYSKRALFCVLSHPILHKKPMQKKNISSFCELIKEFFENLNQENKVTYFLKNLKYPKFIEKVLDLTEENNLNVENFDVLMLDERVPFSKIVLSVKGLVGMTSVVETRKLFYEVFLKIMLRQDFVGNENIVKDIKITADSFSNIMGLSKPSTILPSDNISMISQDELNEQLKELIHPLKEEIDESQLQTSVSEESSGDKNGLIKKGSYEKKEKRPKQIALLYPFKQPEMYPELEKFWETATRQSKLQRALIKAHSDPFSKSKFKAYVLAMKERPDMPSVEEVEQERIYLSTILQRHNKVSHHFIDLQEFKKREKESKLKQLFVFYKVKNQQVYLPSYVLQFIQ